MGGGPLIWPYFFFWGGGGVKTEGVKNSHHQG